MVITLNVWWIPALLTLGILAWPYIVPHRPQGLWDIDMRFIVLVPLLLLVWLLFFAAMYFCK